MRIGYILFSITVLAAFASADTITTTDGVTITGRITRQSADAVAIEITSAGTAIQQSVPRSKISSLRISPKPTGPVYLEVPLIGSVGQQITAPAIETAFAAARRLGANHVVFLLDSPGGTVAEMERIIDALSRNADLKTIAFVKNANSAAALIAAACGTIVMHPVGKCGAAVPYMADKQGLPVAVSEKLTSAMRATARNAARVGGRPSELLIGMIDPDFELWALERESQVLISLEKPKDGGTCIKPKGKVLTLTPEEAMRYGLAKGICRSMKDVGAAIGAASWQTCGDDGWEIMRRCAASQDPQQESADNARSPEEQTRDNEIANLKQRILDSQSAISAFKKQLAGLDKQLADNLQKLADEHRAAVTAAQGDEGRALKESLARDTYQRGASQARFENSAKRADLDNSIAVLEQRITDDTQRLNKMQTR